MPKILLLVVIVLLGGISWLGLRQHRTALQILGITTQRQLLEENIKQDLIYWEQIASASPTYREAYIQLAVLSYQVSDSTAAKKYLQKVLEVDPNWTVPTPLSHLAP